MKRHVIQENRRRYPVRLMCRTLRDRLDDRDVPDGRPYRRAAYYGAVAAIPKPGMLHLVDHGVPYASCDYQRRLAHAGIRCSISRNGNCWGNAGVKRFSATPKQQVIHDRRYLLRIGVSPCLYPGILSRLSPAS